MLEYPPSPTDPKSWYINPSGGGSIDSHQALITAVQYFQDPNNRYLIDYQTFGLVYTDPVANSGLAPMLDPNMFYIVAGDETDMEQVLINLFPDFIYSGNNKGDLTGMFETIPKQIISSWIDQNIKPMVSIPPAPRLGAPEGFWTWINPATNGTEYWPDSEWLSWKKVKRGLMDLYNNANIQAMKSAQIPPWTWEFLKVDAWEKNNNVTLPAVNLLTKDLLRTMAKYEIRALYDQLPTIVDLGLEYVRATSVDQLMQMDEFASCIGVINAYANLDPDHASVLAKELDPANNVVNFVDSVPISDSDHPLSAVLPVT